VFSLCVSISHFTDSTGEKAFRRGAKHHFQILQLAVASEVFGQVSVRQEESHHYKATSKILWLQQEYNETLGERILFSGWIGMYSQLHFS
jgi:energy-converting hydrogenase A subunit M